MTEAAAQVTHRTRVNIGLGIGGALALAALVIGVVAKLGYFTEIDPSLSSILLGGGVGILLSEIVYLKLRSPLEIKKPYKISITVQTTDIFSLDLQEKDRLIVTKSVPLLSGDSDREDVFILKCSVSTKEEITSAYLEGLKRAHDTQKKCVAFPLLGLSPEIAYTGSANCALAAIDEFLQGDGKTSSLREFVFYVEDIAERAVRSQIEAHNPK